MSRFFLLLLIISFSACHLLKFEKAEPIPEPVKKKKVVKKVKKLKYYTNFKDLKFSSAQIEDYSARIPEVLKKHQSKLENYNFVVNSLISSGKNYDLNPLILLAIAIETSKGNPLYDKEAKGFIPLTDQQGKFVSDLYDLNYSEEEELLNPAVNIDLACSLLKFFRELYKNNFEHALLGYHWGLDETAKYIRTKSKLPSKEVAFLKAVSSQFNQILSLKLPEKPVEEAKKEDVKLVKLQDTGPKVDYLNVDTTYDYELFKKFYVSKKKLSAEKQAVLAKVFAAATEQKADPLYFASVVSRLSDFNSKKVRPEHRGLLQINTANAKYLARLTKTNWRGEKALLEADYNLSLGLKSLLLSHTVFNNESVTALVGFRYGIKPLITLMKEGRNVNAGYLEDAQKILADYRELKKEFSAKVQASTEQQIKQAEQEKINQAGAREQVKNYQASTTVRKTQTIQEAVCEQLKQEYECNRLASKLSSKSKDYQQDPKVITALAKVASNFNAKLASKNLPTRYGLFQFSEDQAAQIADYVKITWEGVDALSRTDYSIKLAVRYVYYLTVRYKGDLKKIVPAFFWTADEFSYYYVNKKTLPNYINTKSIEFFKFYPSLKD